ncbi:MAG: hypothetical protein Q9227_009070 [Pyrenula ochraceoflavens]
MSQLQSPPPAYDRGFPPSVQSHRPRSLTVSMGSHSRRASERSPDDIEAQAPQLTVENHYPSLVNQVFSILSKLCRMLYLAYKNYTKRSFSVISLVGMVILLIVFSVLADLGSYLNTKTVFQGFMSISVGVGISTALHNIKPNRSKHAGLVVILFSVISTTASVITIPITLEYLNYSKELYQDKNKNAGTAVIYGGK